MKPSWVYVGHHPAELRQTFRVFRTIFNHGVRSGGEKVLHRDFLYCLEWSGDGEIRTHGPLRIGTLARSCLEPLGHVSGFTKNSGCPSYIGCTSLLVGRTLLPRHTQDSDCYRVVLVHRIHHNYRHRCCFAFCTSTSRSNTKAQSTEHAEGATMPSGSIQLQKTNSCIGRNVVNFSDSVDAIFSPRNQFIEFFD